MKPWYSNSGHPKSLIFIVLTLFSLAGCFSADTQAGETQNGTTNTDSTSKPAEANATATAQPAKTENATAKKAEKKDEIEEGVHYVEIFPEMQTDAPAGKVEVVELFWLGCPHCYSLEPFIKNYKKSKPGYVHFDQVPAVLNPSWKSHAKAFYTAKAVDPENKLQLIGKMFYAIHEQGRRLSSASAQKRFFAQHGVSEKAFDSAYDSMLMTSNLSRANTVSRTSQATGVPAIIIGGKYRTSAYMAGTEAKLLKVINKLTKELQGQ